MADSTPKNADEFIKQQLDRGAEAIEAAFTADAIALNGPLVSGVDGFLRDVVEEKRDGSSRRNLVFLLTTLGGYIEVVERIADTLRRYYDRIDFVIPSHAYSAGTVLAMCGDSIHMDYFSRLGPIDPQVKNSQGHFVSALGYLVQYERLLRKASSKEGLTSVEMALALNFDLGELYDYEQARELSVDLLKKWLVKYKFREWYVTRERGLAVDDEMRTRRAEEIARKLNETDRWHTHSRGISMDVLDTELNLRIDDFGRKGNEEVSKRIRNYSALLDDCIRMGDEGGAIHTIGRYVPFYYEDDDEE